MTTQTIQHEITVIKPDNTYQHYRGLTKIDHIDHRTKEEQLAGVIRYAAFTRIVKLVDLSAGKVLAFSQPIGYENERLPVKIELTTEMGVSAFDENLKKKDLVVGDVIIRDVMPYDLPVEQPIPTSSLPEQEQGAEPKKPTVKRAIQVTRAAKDFRVSRPTIYKWEQGKGTPPANFTLQNPAMYAACLIAYEQEKSFQNSIVEKLDAGRSFSGHNKTKPRTITRGDIGRGREAE